MVKVNRKQAMSHTIYISVVNTWKYSALLFGSFSIVRVGNIVTTLLVLIFVSWFPVSRIHISLVLTIISNHFLANPAHDCAMFVRYEEKGLYNFIHYNPTPGVRSNVAMKLYSLFKNHRARGYHNVVTQNSDGACTFYSWRELLRFLFGLENPFNKKDLLDYSHKHRMYL